MRIAVEMRVGALGFDTTAKLTGAQYQTMRLLGFSWRAGYLGDLTDEEISAALGAKVGIVPVMHAHPNGWRPSDYPGRVDGQKAIEHWRECALPPCDIWADLEVTAAGTTPEEVLLWSGGVCAPIVAAGCAGGVYVGADQPCDSAALYKLAFTGYWQAMSEVPPVAVRGYRLIQLFAWPKGETFVRDVFPEAPECVRDLPIDVDVAQSDKRGVRPRMVVEV